MPHARFLGFCAGIPAGLLYFSFFGWHFWQSVVVAFFVSSLFSVLAGIFLAIVKLAEKLNVDLDKE